ncbi:unnamed protein product [Caenorhabditis sp. 36 PRJEB53466]|nr:unnamed protein product [Caenorhabditis sp. 36 PRJEB53466]
MIDTSAIALVVIVLVLLPIPSIASNSIDWCEYWARVANQNEFLKTDRPECAGYELPSGLKRTETFSCSKTEMYNCLDCEPTCHNLVPKCRKVRASYATVFTIRDTRVQRSVQEQCNKGCVCKNGLARNSEGRCVSFRDCASHAPPKNDSVKVEQEEEGTVMKTVKKMVPVIVNDVWKALFNSMSTPDEKKGSTSSRKHVVTPELKPKFVEKEKPSVEFTTPPATEIVKEEIEGKQKEPQKTDEMNNGARLIHCRLLRLNSILRIQPQIWRRSVNAVSTITEISMFRADQKLVKRNDFRGVTAAKEKKKTNNPDVILSKIQENLRKNYRISASVILFDVIRQLEEGNDELTQYILRSPNRWIPLLISSCGHPLSNVENAVKNEILERLWSKLSAEISPMPAYAWDARLRVLNEISSEWDPLKELDVMERSGIEPTIKTFHAVVDRISTSGDVDGCRNMVYNMARRGFAVDAHINAASVFVFSLRGHYKKADSLCEQAATKYGEEGSRLAYGAAVRAAACRGDDDRLRHVLRKCVIKSTKKLELSSDDILETIWQMAEKSRDGKGAECSQLVEQMLNCTMRDAGFFRKLFREIEKHICHRHYYTALSLLEDTKRVSDCLENQNKNMFLHQLVGRLSSQLIRHHEPAHFIRDVANRVHIAFNSKTSRTKIRMYDDLLYATLMLKEMDVDDRMLYFRSFVDEIDMKRERIHITLPLIMSEEDINQRLAILFRLSTMGYRDWSNLDIDPLVSAILQPLYNNGRPFRDQTKLDKLARIMKSYGISERQTWLLLHKWAKKKADEEVNRPEEQWSKPFARDLRGWCRAYYLETFETPKVTAKKSVQIPYEKLKSCVDQGDIAKTTLILNSNGWPVDTDFQEIVPSVLNLYLMHEPWKNVRKMLEEVATFSTEWDEEPVKTPIKNFHLLRVLQRFAGEGDTLSIRGITDYTYELRTLFPYARCYYEGFFETQRECRKLFVKCFERLDRQHLTTTSIDELIDFLRCLVKLDLIQLHPSETLTVFFINILLKRVGWSEALNTWQKFLSSLHCSNGTVALLRHCLQQNSDEAKKNMQFVLHRGSTFMSQSRMTAMQLAVLIGMRRFEEADKVCDQSITRIEANDCLMAMRLMNALKERSFDDQFMLDFAALCLRKLQLAEQTEIAQSMQADLLRICDSRHMGPAALRVYDLFSEYGVELRDEEKNRLATAIEKHASLSKRWIFKPDGFLNIAANDEIITESEETRIQKKLKTTTS